MVFELIKEAPLTERVRSRDGCIYFYNSMKFLGWFPPEKGILRYLCLCWKMVPFLFSTLCLPIAFIFSYIKEISKFAPGDFLTSLQVCINAHGASVKILATYMHVWRLNDAKKVLDELDLRCTSDSDRKKIHFIVARTNYVFLIYTIVYCGFAGSTFLSSVLSGHPPWQVYNPFFDYHDSKLKLWGASIVEYIIMSGAVLQDQIADIYPLVYTLILRTHLELLKERIHKLRTDKTLTEDENYDALVKCVLDHKLILKFCSLLRPVIAQTIFVQFLLIGVVLGLTLINVFFFSDLWTGLASFLFVITILLQTFPFCYTCNLIIDDCADLANAVFQSNWIDSQPRYQSTLLYFLHNVQQPIIFIAGGIFPVSMNSNISVAKFAFSVITITKQMNIADKFKND